MQLNIFTYLGKINPREKYFLACQLLSINPVVDYLDYNKLCIDPKQINSAAVKKLVDVMNPDPESKAKKNESIKKALQLYLSYDSRVFTEGILFSFGNDITSDFLQIEKEVLNVYSDLFFNIADFKGTSDKPAFYEFIRVNEVQDWFRRVDKFTLHDLEYLVKGKLRRAHKTSSILEDVIQSLYNGFSALSKQNDFLLKDDTNKNMKRISLMLGYVDKINVIARTQLQFDDILNKNQKSFMQEWKVKLDTKKAERFKDMPSQEIEDSIKEQINKISPISQAEPVKKSKPE